MSNPLEKAINDAFNTLIPKEDLHKFSWNVQKQDEKAVNPPFTESYWSQGKPKQVPSSQYTSKDKNHCATSN